MKNTLKILFSLSLVGLLCSCDFIHHDENLDWEKLKNDGEAISTFSSSFGNYSTSFNSTNFHKNMEKADEIVVNQGSINSLDSYLTNVLDATSSLRQKLMVARTRYHATGLQTNKEKYDELYSEYLSFYTWYYPFLLHIQTSSDAIYNYFFRGMNKQEVEDYINDFKYDENTKKLDTEISDIEDKQEKLYQEFAKKRSRKEIDPDDPEYRKYMLDSLDNFRELISKGEEYAEYMGYDNYMDFVYEKYYNRDYTYEYVAEYEPYITNYVIPMVHYYEEHVDKSILDNKDKKIIYEKYFSSNIADKGCYQGDALDSYVVMMGGKMNSAYHHLKTAGMYCFSSNDSSLGTAYVTTMGDEPIIYFSKNYQSTSTIVHEFGHYFAIYTNDDTYTFPYDILETHSQANELLFAKYLLSYYKEDTNYDIYKYIVDSQIYEMLQSTAYTYATAEVETYAYAHLDKSNDALLADILEIMKKYDGIIYSAYWATPIVTSTGYYFSYAPSGAAAVAAYIQAGENFEIAKANYLSFVAYPKENKHPQDFYTYSGLYSPYEESTFLKFTHENLFSF